jgi:hypothetical protein
MRKCHIFPHFKLPLLEFPVLAPEIALSISGEGQDIPWLFGLEGQCAPQVTPTWSRVSHCQQHILSSWAGNLLTLQFQLTTVLRVTACQEEKEGGMLVLDAVSVLTAFTTWEASA